MSRLRDLSQLIDREIQNIQNVPINTGSQILLDLYKSFSVHKPNQEQSFVTKSFYKKQTPLSYKQQNEQMSVYNFSIQNRERSKKLTKEIDNLLNKLQYLQKKIQGNDSVKEENSFFFSNHHYIKPKLIEQNIKLYKHQFKAKKIKQNTIIHQQLCSQIKKKQQELRKSRKVLSYAKVNKTKRKDQCCSYFQKKVINMEKHIKYLEMILRKSKQQLIRKQQQCKLYKTNLDKSQKIRKNQKKLLKQYGH